MKISQLLVLCFPPIFFVFMGGEWPENIFPLHSSSIILILEKYIKLCSVLASAHMFLVVHKGRGSTSLFH